MGEQSIKGTKGSLDQPNWVFRATFWLSNEFKIVSFKKYFYEVENQGVYIYTNEEICSFFMVWFLVSGHQAQVMSITTRI